MLIHKMIVLLLGEQVRYNSSDERCHYHKHYYNQSPASIRKENTRKNKLLVNNVDKQT
ncbi:hypothetical protein [Psychrobacter sp. LV10R520-6]|uniref:hypothetical protein n=1 Tax=Psychrobacter sp. LV10R520-6 TaxID=1415574 RepID=UPI0024CAEDE0|nr:hypothetical protein [Psychrobacter sp. LV10R520-6]SNT69781.1 hypothetical protein SAMN04488491_0885 [Psychrobacter sp. LV10R520-6]